MLFKFKSRPHHSLEPLKENIALGEIICLLAGNNKLWNMSIFFNVNELCLSHEGVTKVFRQLIMMESVGYVNLTNLSSLMYSNFITCSFLYNSEFEVYWLREHIIPKIFCEKLLAVAHAVILSCILM